MHDAGLNCRLACPARPFRRGRHGRFEAVQPRPLHRHHAWLRRGKGPEPLRGYRPHEGPPISISASRSWACRPSTRMTTSPCRRATSISSDDQRQPWAVARCLPRAGRGGKGASARATISRQLLATARESLIAAGFENRLCHSGRCRDADRKARGRIARLAFRRPRRWGRPA